jgi:hypothetical protein
MAMRRIRRSRISMINLAIWLGVAKAFGVIAGSFTFRNPHPAKAS